MCTSKGEKARMGTCLYVRNEAALHSTFLLTPYPARVHGSCPQLALVPREPGPPMYVCMHVLVCAALHESVYLLDRVCMRLCRYLATHQKPRHCTHDSVFTCVLQFTLKRIHACTISCATQVVLEVKAQSCKTWPKHHAMMTRKKNWTWKPLCVGISWFKCDLCVGNHKREGCWLENCEDKNCDQFFPPSQQSEETEKSTHSSPRKRGNRCVWIVCGCVKRQNRSNISSDEAPRIKFTTWC